MNPLRWLLNFAEPWKTTYELQHLTPEARKAAWKVAAKAARTWRFRCGFFAVFGAYALVSIITMRNVRGWPDYGVIRVVTTALYVAGILLVVRYFNSRVRRLILHSLRAEYAGLLLPTCLKCGYPLRGCESTAVQCPECGNDEVRGNPAHALDPKDIIKF